MRRKSCLASIFLFQICRAGEENDSRGITVENWISVAPDWVCEILSPNTARADKVRKMPIYAQHAVPYLWLVDPTTKTLDVFKLESGRWMLLATFAEDDKVRAEPFIDVAIELKNLWLD